MMRYDHDNEEWEDIFVLDQAIDFSIYDDTIDER